MKGLWRYRMEDASSEIRRLQTSGAQIVRFKAISSLVKHDYGISGVTTNKPSKHSSGD